MPCVNNYAPSFRRTFPPFIYLAHMIVLQSYAPMPATAVGVPEGHLKIARCFNTGIETSYPSSLEGMAESIQSMGVKYSHKKSSLLKPTKGCSKLLKGFAPRGVGCGVHHQAFRASVFNLCPFVAKTQKTNQKQNKPNRKINPPLYQSTITKTGDCLLRPISYDGTHVFHLFAMTSVNIGK
jgi:hypothetical protein